MTNNKGNSDFAKGVATNVALEIPKSEAIGLTQTAVQAPVLHTAKNNGIIELILPDRVAQNDFNLFIIRRLTAS